MKKKNRVVVLYHKSCGDGFGAAWAAWRKFGARAIYIGVTYQEPPPKEINGAELYICDFSYPVETMKHLRKTAHRVVALDHHISAEASTKMADEYRYELNHSGAVIAWHYFHPKKMVPLLLRHIEDIDIWKWKLPFTREVIAYINSYPFDFKLWSRFERELENPRARKNIIKEGGAIVRYEQKIINRVVGIAQKVSFHSRQIYAANSNILVSEIGNALTSKKAPMAIVWSERGGFVFASLRSKGRVDVSRIAATYGGGGHKRASSFSFPADKPKPWKILK